MAFVTRSHRVTMAEGNKATNELVGPGSYRGPDEYRIDHAYAPFASTAERVTMETAYSPGPGAYTKLAYNARRDESSSAFKNRVARLPKDRAEETPGPGSYGSTSFVKANKYRQQLEMPARRVMFQRMPTAPSVPVKHQTYGYEEGDAGELVMQAPTEIGHTGTGGDTVGPAKYTPNLESVKPKRQTDFSRSRLKRELPGFSANSGKTPGPGHYEKPGAISDNTGLNIVGEDPYAYANSSSFASRVPLKHHVVLEEDQVTPGPGSYGHKAGFKLKKVPEPHQFFGSTSMRPFQMDISRMRAAPTNQKTPGPGAYTDKTAQFQNPQKTGPDVPPFQSTQLRFEMNKSLLNLPGPGSYDEGNELNFVGELSKKVVSRNGVFGSTTQRFASAKSSMSYLFHGEEGPGPGTYEDPPEQRVASPPAKHSKQTSNFASGSNRFGRSASADAAQSKPRLLSKQPVPAPGAYNLPDKWIKRQGVHRTDHMISQEERFKMPGARDPGETPGPGQYQNNKVAQRPVQNRTVFTSNSARFLPASTYSPGPGAYTSSDPLSTMVKRSFNVTIDGVEF
mmetsp:Transcript_29772/g.65038  ORF Transcript_29772/g.65038 Transcript_29772/m.65038 type:complete len:565 (-) Transcript_29772:839-2533(-)